MADENKRYLVWCEDWVNEDEAKEVEHENAGFAACDYIVDNVGSFGIGDEFVCHVRDPEGKLRKIKVRIILKAIDMKAEDLES